METGYHLFQPPLYSAGDGFWSDNYLTVASRNDQLSWDPAAFVSAINFGYICGDHTLLREVRRQPWMSTIQEDGSISLNQIPEHGFYHATSKQIGSRLLRLLELEAEKVCRNVSDIYVLTSGGLDSRIVAGVVHRLKQQGRIGGTIRSMTWGRSQSRDVEIGRIVAERLGFEWEHLELKPEHLLQNQEISAEYLGALISPLNLHRMPWFRTLPPGGVVLGGSYGDSVGRAEFSGRTVLELQPLRFVNQFDLMTSSAFECGTEIINNTLTAFQQRANDKPVYAMRECEQQAHYMRSTIAQTMSIINGPCRLYQMFTAPAVFEFMWSIHPSFRDDQPYQAVLEMLGNDLDRLPWARTDRAPGKGSTITVNAKHKSYHDYPNWIRSQIQQSFPREELAQFANQSGIFSTNAIDSLIEKLSQNSATKNEQNLAASHLVWLESVRRLNQKVTAPTTCPAEICNSSDGKNKATIESTPAPQVSYIRRKLRNHPALLSTVQKYRKRLVRKRAIKEFPSVPLESNELSEE